MTSETPQTESIDPRRVWPTWEGGDFVRVGVAEDAPETGAHLADAQRPIRADGSADAAGAPQAASVLSDEALAEMAVAHACPRRRPTQHAAEPDLCNECGMEWPCDASRLLDEVARLRKALQRLVEIGSNTHVTLLGGEGSPPSAVRYPSPHHLEALSAAERALGIDQTSP